MRDAGLGTKLNVALLVFFLLLGAAMSAVLIYGFGRTQDDASARSQEALEEVGSLALSAVVGGTAEQGGILFSSAATTGERASTYLETVKANGRTVPTDPQGPRLVRDGQNGIQYDPRPTRNSDFLLWPGVDPASPDLIDEREYSAPLDDAFAALFAGLAGETAFSPSAMAFLGVNGVSRFYPALGVQETMPPDVVADIETRLGRLFAIRGPEGNPERLTKWTAPYEDNAGQGLVVTAETPVYDGDTFRGVIQVDLLIQSLMDQIDSIQPTPGSFAFYVDSVGTLARGAAYDRLTVAAAENADVAEILALMQDSGGLEGVAVRRVKLDGAEFFFAYASMPALGGAFGIASPIREITAAAEVITAGIEEQGGRTLRVMLGAMGALFIVGLAGASYLNRRVLVGPIAELVSGTRAIGAGAMETAIPVRSGDELGMLAQAFNQMTEDLSETEGRYKRIFDSSADGLTISRLDGTVVDANAAACKMLGYTRDEFLALPAGAHIHPRFRDQRDGFLDAMRDGKPYVVRAVDIRKDGSTFDVDVRAVPLQYRGDQHVLSVLRDVSAEVRTEQILEERVAERTRELGLLLDVSRNVASTLDMQDLATRILDQLGDVFEHDGAGLLLLEDDEVVVLQSRTREGATDSVLAGSRFRLPLNGPAGDAIAQKQTIVVPDVEADDSLAAQRREVVGAAQLGRSWLAAPLVIQDRVLGVLTLWSAKPDTYGDEDRALATAVANQAAIALENARLFEEASTVGALEERQRLARELHDSVSQALYGIGLGAQTARQLLESDPAKAVQPVEYVVALAEAGLAEMRALIFELRPESLEMEGLVSALDKQAAATRARYGLVVQTDLPEEPDLPLRAKEALYRIAQEAMHNTIKHARASRIELRLAVASAVVRLEVSDDGAGFDAAGDFPGHLGLRSMRERAVAAGGTLELSSVPGQGTRILAEIPVAPSA